MKKLLTFILLTFWVATISQAVPAPSKEDFLGEWKFESQHAPYGYEKGYIVILEKEGVLSGEIKFAEGTKVQMTDVKFEENVLKFGIAVDYYAIPIKATIEGNKMKGTATTPEGDLPFEATKVEKTE